MVPSTHHRGNQNIILAFSLKEPPNTKSRKFQVQCPLMSMKQSLNITWSQHLKRNQPTLNRNGNMNRLQKLPILRFPPRLLPCHQGIQLRCPIGLVCPTLFLGSLLIHSPSSLLGTWPKLQEAWETRVQASECLERRFMTLPCHILITGQPLLILGSIKGTRRGLCFHRIGLAPAGLMLMKSTNIGHVTLPTNIQKLMFM